MIKTTITISLWLGGFMLLTACTEPEPSANFVQPKQSLTVFGPSEVRRHSNQPLGPRTKNELETRGDGAFGAFYIRPDGRAWGFVTGRYTEQDARLMAKIDCDIVSGGNCILYATIVPQDEFTEHTIPNNHMGALAEAKRETAPSNYFAIANNPAGYTGFGINYATQAEAKSGAMTACAKVTKSTLVNEEARFLAAYKAAGLLECKIFGVYR